MYGRNLPSLIDLVLRLFTTLVLWTLHWLPIRQQVIFKTTVLVPTHYLADLSALTASTDGCLSHVLWCLRSSWYPELVLPQASAANCCAWSQNPEPTTCSTSAVVSWAVVRRRCDCLGTSQLVTRSTCHIVKSCDELTVVSEGVVTSWPYFLTYLPFLLSISVLLANVNMLSPVRLSSVCRLSVCRL